MTRGTPFIEPPSILPGASSYSPAAVGLQFTQDTIDKPVHWGEHPLSDLGALR